VSLRANTIRGEKARQMAITAYTFHLHFWRLCLRVFIRFSCVWSFLRFHRTCRNADVPGEACLQFLQEVYSIFSENNLKECNVRVSCICHCRLQRNTLNVINLFALSQTATFSKKFSFRFNSIPTKSDVHKPL